MPTQELSVRKAACVSASERDLVRCAVRQLRASEKESTTTERSAAHETATREFLSFRLGDAEYGIDILKVQEIRGCDPVSRIANTPEFIKGVIDLRGIIVPIIDMRLKFRLEHTQ